MGHSPRKIAYANSFFYKVWFDTTKKKSIPSESEDVKKSPEGADER